jgi:hypothetical protein
VPRGVSARRETGGWSFGFGNGASRGAVIICFGGLCGCQCLRCRGVQARCGVTRMTPEDGPPASRPWRAQGRVRWMAARAMPQRFAQRRSR